MSDPWKFPPPQLWPTSPGAHDNEVTRTIRADGFSVDYRAVGAAAVDTLVQRLEECAPPEPPVLALAGLEVPAKQRPMQKLGRTMMRSFAARLLKVQQGGMCPLCKKEIDLSIKGEGVLDHDHDSGEIRGVLHRSCNAAEGKISNAAARWGAKSSSYSAITQYLENLVQYLRSPGAGMLYPMHKTPDEKRDDRNAKARAQRAATKAKLALRGRKV